MITAIVPYTPTYKIEFRRCPLCGTPKELAKWIKIGILDGMLKCPKCSFTFEIC